MSLTQMAKILSKFGEQQLVMVNYACGFNDYYKQYHDILGKLVYLAADHLDLAFNYNFIT